MARRPVERASARGGPGAVPRSGLGPRGEAPSPWGRKAGADGAVNPSALTTGLAAKLLSAMGLGPVTEKTIAHHLASGAPHDAQGRINLVHYAAWLVKELAERRKMQGRS